MKSEWMLQNREDVTGTVRKFLRDLWLEARLDGMFFPRYSTEAVGAQPFFAENWLQLDRADPFAPLMLENSAGTVARMQHGYPRKRLAAVLHPCEVRSLRALARYGLADLEHLLLIGVDCLGTYPLAEYTWRAEQHGPEQLTRDTLQFARQGGILFYRYRRACQMCTSPVPEDADLNVAVLGLPVRQAILVLARDGETARRLGLDRITDGEAPPALVAQHDQMRATLADRRGRARDQIFRQLPAAPHDLSGLEMFLSECMPCQACREACPFESAGLPVRDWVSACAGCGMCEERCPTHQPLTALVSRVRQEMALAV